MRSLCANMRFLPFLFISVFHIKNAVLCEIMQFIMSILFILTHKFNYLLFLSDFTFSILLRLILRLYRITGKAPLPIKLCDNLQTIILSLAVIPVR